MTQPDPDTLYSFAGEQAATAQFDRLAEAKAMHEDGKSAPFIYQETGWMLGVDHRWRFEISDDQARLKLSELDLDGAESALSGGVTYSQEGSLIKAAFGEGATYLGAFGRTEEDAFKSLVRHYAIRQAGPDGFDLNKVRPAERFTLDTVLDHPELFAAYPFLRTTLVTFTEDPSYNGHYQEKLGLITLRMGRPPEEILSTLLHEVQHAIQFREDFARGGNSDTEFTESVRAVLGQMEDHARTDLENWRDRHAQWLVEEYEASDLLTDALKYESALRLKEYAARERPSGVFRLIRNESQWLYHSEFYRNREATDLQALYYGIPNRGEARNERIRELAQRTGAFIMNSIPEKRRQRFEADQRTVKSMIRAAEREAGKARKRLAPMHELEGRLRQAQSLTRSMSDKCTFGIYRSLGGEVEARLTQARQHLTAEERRQRFPARDMDTPASEIIVLLAGQELVLPMPEQRSMPEPVTGDDLKRAAAQQFPGIARDIDTLLERGEAGLPGGLVLEEPQLLNGQAPQGAFSRKNGIITLSTHLSSPNTAMAVLAHEVIHSQGAERIDAQALAMIEDRQQQTNPRTRAFLERVARRMQDAGAEGRPAEASAYLVEQAVLEGRRWGQHDADSRFARWADRCLGKTVGNWLRSALSQTRLAFAARGVPVLGKLTLDDFLMHAQVGIRRAAQGLVQTRHRAGTRQAEASLSYS